MGVPSKEAGSLDAAESLESGEAFDGDVVSDTDFLSPEDEEFGFRFRLLIGSMSKQARFDRFSRPLTQTASQVEFITYRRGNGPAVDFTQTPRCCTLCLKTIYPQKDLACRTN